MTSDTSVSDAIANGVCTRCKGDAYLFYDAAGGHCWKCDVAELTAALLAARREDATQVALRALLEKATTRLEILQGRMAACDDASVMAGRDDMHRLSLFEIPGWIEEQRAALATPATSHITEPR